MRAIERQGWRAGRGASWCLRNTRPSRGRRVGHDVIESYRARRVSICGRVMPLVETERVGVRWCGLGIELLVHVKECTRFHDFCCAPSDLTEHGLVQNIGQ